MVDYDFTNLNDKEFEVFCVDLLGRCDSVRYERFKPGKDAGIDGRFFQSDGGEVILQCKHWFGTPLPQLIKELQNTEKPKIDKISPKRYIIAVSKSLSRANKAEIQKVLSPHISTPTDILGKEDLNDLLSRHSDVERRHYKLWLHSSGVLVTLLNKGVFDRSNFYAEEIIERSKLYVRTSNHDAALQKLDSVGVVIITGPAGIGKTTLADHLILEYIRLEYSLIKISEEIKEAEAVYEVDAKQIFYFDDFLGRNYLEALNGHEGSHIVQFIRRISRDKKKRFVLTSRSTILNQGKILIDAFDVDNIFCNEYEILIGSFTDMDKAKILYNHIWFSELVDRYIDEIYNEKRYLKIIKHKNFNPRLIRYITDFSRFKCIGHDEYWEQILGLLNNPAKIWENPFEAQLDDFGRAIVQLVALSGGKVNEDEISKAFSRMIASPENLNMQGRKDFLVNIKHLSGSMLNRDLQRNSFARLDLFDPSIGDYILHRYSNDVPSLRLGFLSLRSSSSLKTLSNLCDNELLSINDGVEILSQIIFSAIDRDFETYSSSYIAVVCVTLFRITKKYSLNTFIPDKCIQFVLNSKIPKNLEPIIEFVDLMFKNDRITSDEALVFLERACSECSSSLAIEYLCSITKKLDSDLDSIDAEIYTVFILPLIEVAVYDYLCFFLHDEFPPDEVFWGLDPSDFGFNDFDAADNRLERMIENKLDCLGICLTFDQVRNMVSEYDIESTATSYFEDSSDSGNGHFLGGSDLFPIQEIDDLFER